MVVGSGEQAVLFHFSLKFIHSEKATKFCKISTLLLSIVHTDKKGLLMHDWVFRLGVSTTSWQKQLLKWTHFWLFFHCHWKHMFVRWFPNHDQITIIDITLVLQHTLNICKMSPFPYWFQFLKSFFVANKGVFRVHIFLKNLSFDWSCKVSILMFKSSKFLI